MDYLPEKYQASRETVAFQEAIQPEIGRIWQAREDFLLQLDPRSASGWGLELWEAAFGLRPLASSSLDQRRSRVVARIRGVGTVTAEMLRSVVESFLVHDVDVTEHPRENRVDIEFQADGVSPDLDDMAAALLEILPAHLGLGLDLRREVPIGVRVGACAQYAAGLEVWPMVVPERSAAAGVRAGVYPKCIREIEIYPFEEGFKHA